MPTDAPARARAPRLRSAEIAVALAALVLAGGLALTPVAAAVDVHLSEGFEGTLSEWSTLSGARITTDLARSGAASLFADASVYGQLGGVDRIIPQVKVASVSVWFYDDMGGCGAGEAKTQLAAVAVKGGSASTILGLGVVTPTSACDYVFRTEYSIVPTSVPRSMGWHEFRIAWNGLQANLSINGVSVHARGYGAAPNQIVLGDYWGAGGWIGNAQGPGWFDDVVLSSDVQPKPGAPRNVRTVPTTLGIHLVWEGPSDDDITVTFRVYRTALSDGRVDAWTHFGRRMELRDAGAMPGASYSYVVTAFRVEESDPAPPVCAAAAYSVATRGPACPAPHGWDDRTLVAQRASVPSLDAGSTPPVGESPLLVVSGSRSAGGTYEIDAEGPVFGRQRAEAPDFGQVSHEFRHEVLVVPAQRLAAGGNTVDVALAARSDPAGPPTDPHEVGWWQHPGQEARLVLTVRVSDAEGRTQAGETATLAYLGQPAGALLP